MKKYMPITKDEMVKMFSLQEREAIMNTLKAFDEVTVTYEYGQYRYSTVVALLAKYPEDYRYIGEIYADDIFSKEERIINYVESFHSYPIEYKGAKNWQMIRDVEGNWNARFGYDDKGNIIRIE